MVSVLNHQHAYVGETICLRTRLAKHNSGYGGDHVNTPNLRPFAFRAFICGFEGEKDIRKQVADLWQQKVDNLRLLYNIDDHHQWALSGQSVIESLHSQRHSDSNSHSELRLVCLFRPNDD